MDNINKRYRVTNGFVHRKVANKDLLITVGEGVANFNGCILLNPTASFLLDLLTEPHTINELSEAVTDEFEVSFEEATADVIEFIQMLVNQKMVKEEDN